MELLQLFGSLIENKIIPAENLRIQINLFPAT